MRKKTLKVLVVVDDAEVVATIRRCLRKGRTGATRVSDVSTLDGAILHLETEEVDLVLLDLGIAADEVGVEVVRRVRRIAPNVPIVVITHEELETLAIQALQRDAQDYVLRHQLNPSTLAQAIRYALEPDRWQGQYRRLLSNSPDGVLIVDTEGRVLFVNASSVGMLGWAPARSAELPEALRVRSVEAIDITLDTGRVAEVREVETQWSGRAARLIMMRDITERRTVERKLNAMAEELRRTNERLERMVGTDPLTQSLNRRGIEDQLGLELRRMSRTGETLMAILIDCDDFKSINDSFGHAVGDASLVALTRSVQDALRVGDHVGRVGGDEFLVLLPATTFAEGLTVADKLRRAIKATALPVASSGLTLSASLGVGAVSPDVVTVEEVLTLLNEALRRSKRAGKDTVSTDPSVESDGGGTLPRSNRVLLEPADIPLDVVVQGIRRLEDGELVGLEALARGPAGHFAAPSDLFRAAFEQNVLTTLDLRALRTSLDRFKTHGWRGWYHVNLFPSTLLNTPAERIVPLLERSGARGSLCIELSEQQFLGDPAYLRPPIRELRAAGFRIGIDDVGFGRSSVEALMLLEPDVVKIDRRCIRSIGSQAGERRQLERLLAMLRAVDATVIVEGIETAEELDVLRDLGVPYGQGFLWDRPGAFPDTPSVAPRARGAAASVAHPS